MRTVVIASALLALAGCSGDAEQTQAPQSQTASLNSAETNLDDGIISHNSPDDVATTVARLEKALEAGGFGVVAKLDHQAKAAKVNQTLSPATVIFFGKPEIGTGLMQVAPSAALDLPQRMAVYQDMSGQTVIAYNDPNWLAERHRISGEDERNGKIATALAKLASAAAGEKMKDEK